MAAQIAISAALFLGLALYVWQGWRRRRQASSYTCRDCPHRASSMWAMIAHCTETGHGRKT